MELRRVIFRIILWSLGASALIGAAAILTGGSDTIGRILGTAFTTSGAAILLYPLSAMIDRRPLRPAGLFGMVLVVIEYAAILSLIWLVWRTTWDDEVLGSTLAVGLVGAGAFVFLLMHAKDAMRVAARFGLAAAGVVLLMFFVAIWNDLFAPRNYDLWRQPWPVIVYSLLVVAALIGCGDGRHWRWFGIACAAAALALVEYDMWFDPKETDLGRNALTFTTVAACVAAHANLVVRAPLRDSQRWLAWGTIGAGIATAALIWLAVFMDEHDADEDVLRFAGAAGVVAACGSLALLVLTRFNRGVNVEPGTTEFKDVTLICPRCRRKQSVPIGGGRCSSCDLRIRVEVEEPRCAKCGYLLYQLTSNTCPECGAPIGVEHEA